MTQAELVAQAVNEDWDENRLAQALVCLTDPVARAAYDRSLGIAPPLFEVVDDEPLAEELWEVLGHDKTLAYEPWPTVEEEDSRRGAEAVTSMRSVVWPTSRRASMLRVMPVSRVMPARAASVRLICITSSSSARSETSSR